MCKGVCCIEGEVGVFVIKEEVEILKEIYFKVKFFFWFEGIFVIEK